MNLLIIFLIVPIVVGKKHDCAGGTFQCDDSATCCQLLDKSYGCCPMKDAVCCDDHIHCCPVNTKCSVGMCIQQELESAKNYSSHIIKANFVTCKDGNYTCPDDTTCCDGLLPSTYGCCPMKNAVCCEDKEHCCPEGTVCDVQEDKCTGDGFITQMYAKKPLFKSNSPEIKQFIPIGSAKLSNVICPGSTFQCPNGYTCCKFESGNWGCCPFPKATCCSDGLHCCPEKMKCDSTSTHCSEGFNNITSSRNILASVIPTESIVCPDKTQCRDGMTCCQLSDTQFGCCDYPNATCCSDRLHCCPAGNMCDVEKRRCIPEKNWLVNFI